MRGRGDTIAAIATHEAAAALGIVRISGPLAGEVLDSVVPLGKARLRPRRVVMGTARDPETNEALDQVVCFFCRGPKTATGEDTAEIQGHGGRLVMRRLLQATLKAGARPAEPGEFTYRAFVNGRLDLTQAEAIMGLIGARSERAARLALSHLAGSLGKVFDAEEAALSAVAAQLEAGLDFPDEDLPVPEISLLTRRLREIEQRLRKLKSSYTLGSSLRDGARVAVIGPPNAGKSSLFNALAGEDRAIVDSDPGTTRDVVETQVEIAGIPVTLSDTAGVREDAGRVERAGIEKSRVAAQTADLVILVLDGTVTDCEYALGLEALISSFAGKPIIAVNKIDLDGWSESAVPSALSGFSRVPTSALRPQGVGQLRESIGHMLDVDGLDEASILTTERQHESIEIMLDHLGRAISILSEKREAELAAAELRWAREEMSRITGRSATDDMLNALFSSFCIGK